MKKTAILIVIITVAFILMGSGVWFFVRWSSTRDGQVVQSTQETGQEGQTGAEVKAFVRDTAPVRVDPRSISAQLVYNEDGSLMEGYSEDEYQAYVDLMKALEAEQTLSDDEESDRPSESTPIQSLGTSDGDRDGLTKDEETRLGTDSTNSDTDGDGLSDGDEVKRYRTNSKNFDTDGDGLGDFEEVSTYRTDPSVADTDGDGFSDGMEVQSGYNPLGSGKLETD